MMSVSNLSFLDKPNYCYVCAKHLDNKKMEDIILECIRHEHEDYMPRASPNDPVILNEEIQFCKYAHYLVYVAKLMEETPEEEKTRKQKEFDRWWKNLTNEDSDE